MGAVGSVQAHTDRSVEVESLSREEARCALSLPNVGLTSSTAIS